MGNSKKSNEDEIEKQEDQAPDPKDLPQTEDAETADDATEEVTAHTGQEPAPDADTVDSPPVAEDAETAPTFTSTQGAFAEAADDTVADLGTDEGDTTTPEMIADEPDDDTTPGDLEENPGTDATDDLAALSDQGAGDDPEPQDPEPQVEPYSVDLPPASQGGRGWLGVLAGVVIAGLIGFGGALFLLPNGLKGGDSSAVTDALSDQAARIDKLAGTVETLSTQVADDGGSQGGVADQITALTQTLGSKIDGFSAEIGKVAANVEKLDLRLTDIEKRPISGNADMAGAVGAYERELDALRQDLVNQRKQNESMAANISSVAESAREEIQAATQKAAQSEERAAMMRVMAALESGGAFSGALDQITSTTPPEALSAAAGGVATLAELQDSFPEYARAALSIARRSEQGNSATDKLQSFLSSQVGLRSLEPREGDGADAVLARAEFALGEDRLGDALGEIGTLPEQAQAVLAPWVEQAAARLAALDAAQALSAQLNQE